MTVEPIEAYVPTHALELNDLDLIGGTGDEGWTVNALGPDFTLGNPVAVITAVLEQILDGALATVESYDNREVDVPILLESPDGPSLAAGEQALVEAVRGTEGRGLLIWTPPSIAAEPSVFEVVYATLDFSSTDDWDIKERNDYGPQRGYMLNLVCKPFARSMDKVEIPGLPVDSGAAEVMIDDGASLTGWSTSNTQTILHNLIPNPGFQTGTSGWSPGAGADSITTSTGGVGGQVLQVNPSTSSGRVYANSDSLTLVTPGGQLTVSTLIRYNRTGGKSSTTAGIRIRYFDASSALIHDEFATSISLPAGTWRKAQGTVAVPDGTVTVQIFPYVEGAGASSWNMYIDQVLVTETSRPVADPYFDGDTADTAHITYSWDGLADESTSTATYPAPALAPGAVETWVDVTTYGTLRTSLTRTGAVVIASDTPYLRIWGHYGWNDVDNPPVAFGRIDSAQLRFYIDGEEIAPDAFHLGTGQFGDHFHAAFHLPDGVATDITVESVNPAGAYDHGARLGVNQITANSSLVDSTGRQTSRTIPVYGSMRAEADIEVTSADELGTPVPLGGQTLVYTAPTRLGIATPDLRQWRTGGGTVTPDTSTISGAYETLGTSEGAATVFEAAAEQITKGTHALWGALRHASAGVHRIHWSATVATAYSSDTVTDYADVLIDSAWQLTPIGHIALPPAAITLTSSAIITLKVWAGDSGVDLDEAWAFNVDSGQVSECDTSGGPSMMRLTAATIDSPAPACWIGDADNEENTIAAGARAAFDQHLFPPGDISVTTIALSSQSVSTALAYYPRWHTHPAAIPTGEEPL